MALLLEDGVVASSTDADYSASLTSYWSLQNQELSPDCIIVPKTAEDVAKSVHLLNTANEAGTQTCEFAIRSGGHTPYQGAANVASGVVIDLSNLKQVKISDDKTTVTIGPGNRWVDVYSVLEAEKLASLGGRVASVGVGGLVTGGGLSFFSPRYGYVCDGVQNFEVVLASGEVVNANATANPDLFRALKGGSNNFGVVTSITLLAFEQGNVWGGQIMSDVSGIGEIFSAFESFTGSADYDPYAALISSVAWVAAQDRWLTVQNVVYTKDVESPPAFERLTSVSPQYMNTAKINSLANITRDMDGSTPSGHRQIFASATYKNSAALMAAIYELMLDITPKLISVTSLIWAVSFQPVPSIMNEKAAASGGNSLGLDASQGNLMNFLISPTWDTKEDDALVNTQVQELLARAEVKARELDVYHPYIYLNYADSWQDPIAGYGAETVARLQAVSKKYDPTGLFQKSMPGGFKLFVHKAE